ncbi:MAG: AI-2E family transporter [Thermodesulfobacteriota bacterium]
MATENMGGIDPVVRGASWLIIFVLATLILKNLDFILVPMAIALLLVYAMGIPLNFLKKFKIPNFLRILLVLLAIIGFFYLLGRLVASNIHEFNRQLPIFEEKFWTYSRNFLALVEMTPADAREMYESFMANFSKADLKPLGSIIQRMGGSLFSFLGDTIWVQLFMVFILAEWDTFPRRIIRAVGPENSRPILTSISRINGAVQHYLGLKTAISAGTGLLVTLVLTLLSVPFALLWGVLAFLLNFIPNIGSLLAVIPPVAIALFDTGSLGYAMITAGLLTGVQLIVGNYVEPRVMGSGLNLSPLVVLLSLVFWGWMWGVPGMLLSVPLTAAFKIAMEQVKLTKPFAIMLSAR